MTDTTPLDRIFIEDEEDRPEQINVDEITTMETTEFVDRLESIADVADTVTEITEDITALRESGLSEEDARDLIYGRNADVRKRDIEALFAAVDELTTGRADRPTRRLLSALSGLTLAETGELIEELDRLRSKY